MARNLKEKGLGRGLDALLGDPEIHQDSEGTLSLPISKVEPGLNQPRKRFEPHALDDLTQSILEHGVIQPIVVRRLSSGYYQIIAGERRWRASKQAGLSDIPAIVIEADDRKVMELGLIENLQREDLNPVEEAKGYHALMDEHNMTQEQVAKRMGKSRPAIANALRLLSLEEQVLSLLEQGTLSAGHARALLSAPSAQVQVQVAHEVVRRNLSVRETEAMMKTIGQEKAEKKTPKQDEIMLYLGEAEKQLSGTLGRKVRIGGKGKKGKIELEYYNQADLEELLSALARLSNQDIES